MTITFSKYHGAGNDFIMIDGRTLKRALYTDEMVYLCHRYFGVGADGIIVIQPDAELDFAMEYYNSDGSSGMMCSNGSRCAIKFANVIGYQFEEAQFSCCDVVYRGMIYKDGLIGTRFPDLTNVEPIEGGYFVNNGTHHIVLFDEDMDSKDLREIGRTWRYNPEFDPPGVNVNFISVVNDNQLKIVTYERGVEDLTLACGTGALAAAMAFVQQTNGSGDASIDLTSKGGTLTVRLYRTPTGFEQVEVVGPVAQVFTTEIRVQKLALS